MLYGTRQNNHFLEYVYFYGSFPNHLNNEAKRDNDVF